MTVSIRAAGPEARDLVLPLMQELQRVERGLDPNRVRPEEIAPHLDDVLARMARDGGFVLLAEAEGRVVGMLIGLIETREMFVPEEGRRIGDVSDLCVTEAARGLGVGRRLMDEAERRFAALGLTRMSVGALAANAAARRLYEGWAGGEYAVIYERAIGAGARSDTPG